mgnify:CR=1 FL=1
MKKVFVKPAVVSHGTNAQKMGSCGKAGCQGK